MVDLPAALLDAARAMSPWEVIAVTLALVYLVLAIRQNVWCWPAALLSASIYLFLMWQASLYLQSVLQLFYMAMACYGWRRWRRGIDDPARTIVSWRATQHIVPLAIIITSGLALGTWMDRFSDAPFPFLDALVACGAVVTTWMVARKVLQNWHYWLIIDTVSLWLFVQQGLWLTAMLFFVYLVLVLVGYRAWRASFRGQDEP